MVAMKRSDFIDSDEAPVIKEEEPKINGGQITDTLRVEHRASDEFYNYMRQMYQGTPVEIQPMTRGQREEMLFNAMRYDIE